MEKVIQRKEQSQYLSLIVKKISKDRLTLRELDNYNLLRLKIDPLGHLEEALTEAWSNAEQQGIGESNSSEKVKKSGRSKIFGLSHNILRLLKRI